MFDVEDRIDEGTIVRQIVTLKCLDQKGEVSYSRSRKTLDSINT